MPLNALIDTATFAATMRDKIIRPASREILVARIAGSEQEQDLTLPPNCGGLGRIRHFQRSVLPGWRDNPLPIDPAAKALRLPTTDVLTAQVFQNAACAWRCWYCYVPFNLLSGDASRGEWKTAAELVTLYAEQEQPPHVIDLSGGSPDLTPEWVIWMMKALTDARLADSTYLWSDDNLSTDYLFNKLDESERQRLVEYRNYGRVCCIKGFDANSFAFNTTADPSGYDYQFEILRRYVDLGIDVYGYVTLTGTDLSSVATGVSNLVDRLRAIHEALPLRVVPLKIRIFAPTLARGERNPDRFAIAESVQETAFDRWKCEIDRHYAASDRALNIADVPLRERQ
jgi:uncharacterized Fe-S cluster-containing radical SAM superfamily protein